MSSIQSVNINSKLLSEHMETIVRCPKLDKQLLTPSKKAQTSCKQQTVGNWRTDYFLKAVRLFPGTYSTKISSQLAVTPISPSVLVKAIYTVSAVRSLKCLDSALKALFKWFVAAFRSGRSCNTFPHCLTSITDHIRSSPFPCEICVKSEQELVLRHPWLMPMTACRRWCLRNRRPELERFRELVSQERTDQQATGYLSQWIHQGPLQRTTRKTENRVHIFKVSIPSALTTFRVISDPTLCFCFRKSEKVSLTSTDKCENQLERADHCPEYPQQHTAVLLVEMCCLSGRCFSCLRSVDFSDESNSTYFCSWKLRSSCKND